MENREIGVRFPTAADVFLLQPIHKVFGSPPPIKQVFVALSRRLKQLWFEAVQSPPPSSKITKAWSNSSTTTGLHGMAFNKAHWYISRIKVFWVVPFWSGKFLARFRRILASSFLVPSRHTDNNDSVTFWRTLNLQQQQQQHRCAASEVTLTLLYTKGPWRDWEKELVRPQGTGLNLNPDQ